MSTRTPEVVQADIVAVEVKKEQHIINGTLNDALKAHFDDVIERLEQEKRRLQSVAQAPPGFAAAQVLPYSPVPVGRAVLRGNGIDLKSSVITERVDSVRIVVERVRRLNCVLIRSPPKSGKTAFGQLLVHFCQRNNIRALLVHATHWNQYCSGLLELLNKPPQEETIVVVDESQLLYDEKAYDQFWKLLKGLMNMASSRIGIVLLSTFYALQNGDSNVGTPIEFDALNSFGIELLRYKKEELKDLVAKFNAWFLGEQGIPAILEKYFDLLFQASSGHPGTVYVIFNFIADENRGTWDPEDFCTLLQSRELLRALLSSRAIKGGLRAIEGDASMLKCLSDAVVDAALLCNIGSSEVQEKLKRLGLLTESVEGGKLSLQFAGDLIRAACFAWIFETMPRKSSVDIVDLSFPRLITLCLEKISRSELRQSYARSSGESSTLYERQWQMAFYRSMMEVLPADFWVSPDVGSVFGSKGYLDFYINGGLKWAIELLRSGTSNTVKEHVSRFAADGIYRQISFNERAILDFRMEGTLFSEEDAELMEDGLWVVFYEHDFSAFRIFSKHSPNGSKHHFRPAV